jgi:hypothetical protein
MKFIGQISLMMGRHYRLVLNGDKFLCIDGYMDVAERVLQIYVLWSIICAATVLKVATLYVTYHPLTKGYLLIFQDTKVVVVLHRKMINWDTVLL